MSDGGLVERGDHRPSRGVRPRCVAAALRALAVLILAVAAAPMAAEAQQARGWVSSTAQVVGMRPVVALSQPCPVDQPCYVAQDSELSAVASQDLYLTGWGFGVQGLSATVQLRARQDLGGSFPWPRADDGFDAMLAYGAFTRGGVTARLGRQELRTGLGFPSFDGALVRISRRAFRVEGYGGRSLARGLREPADQALRGLEDFVPDQSVYLFGGSLRGRIASAAVTARYHREILGDRSGLASERASVDVSAAAPVGTVRAALDYDFGRGVVGKGHLTLARTFQDARWHAELSAARYVPYFSLSTIWGFFEPVSYTEGVLRVGWAPSAAWALRSSFGLRRYGDTGTAVILRPLEHTGRRGELDVRWRPAPVWNLGATYALEWGPGGYLSSIEGRTGWTPAEDTHVTLFLRSFQQIEQYRLGDGRALGGGLSAGIPVTDRLSVSGGASLLRHRTTGSAELSPWNQARGWTSVRLLVGRDPGSVEGGGER